MVCTSSAASIIVAHWDAALSAPPTARTGRVSLAAARRWSSCMVVTSHSTRVTEAAEQRSGDSVGQVVDVVPDGIAGQLDRAGLDVEDEAEVNVLPVLDQLFVVVGSRLNIDVTPLVQPARKQQA